MNPDAELPLFAVAKLWLAGVQSTYHEGFERRGFAVWADVWRHAIGPLWKWVQLLLWGAAYNVHVVEGLLQQDLEQKKSVFFKWSPHGIQHLQDYSVWAFQRITQHQPMILLCACMLRFWSKRNAQARCTDLCTHISCAQRSMVEQACGVWHWPSTGSCLLNSCLVSLRTLCQILCPHRSCSMLKVSTIHAPCLVWTCPYCSIPTQTSLRPELITHLICHECWNQRSSCLVSLRDQWVGLLCL